MSIIESFSNSVIPVQLHLELEVNLLVHNVIEREKVQMKPPVFAPSSANIVTKMKITYLQLSFYMLPFSYKNE